MRQFLRVILLIGMLGTLAELLLLEHTEGYWQRLPLALLVLGLAATMVEVMSARRWPRLTLQVVMAVFLIGGAIGLVQHYQVNREFEREMYPTRRGLELAWESLKGATPTLAPAAMIQLGLLGLLYSRPRPEVGSKRL